MFDAKPTFNAKFAAALVLSSLPLAACGGTNPEVPSSFYSGLEGQLLDEGLAADLTTCIVDGVRTLDLSPRDVSHFEKTGDFSDSLSNQLDARTTNCFTK